MTGRSVASMGRLSVVARSAPASILDGGTLERMIASAGRRCALLLLALDELDLLDAAAGTATADAVAAAFGDRLCAGLPELCHAARLQSDVFAVLIPADDLMQAKAVARTIARRVAVPYRVDGRDIHLAISRGMSVSRPWATGESRLMADAQAALQIARREGGGSVHFDDVDVESPDTLSLAEELRQALAEQALTVAYQPVLDLDSGQIRSVEATAQWRHPQRGMIGGDVIVAIADRFGLAGALGEWLLDEVCAYAGHLRRERSPVVSTSIRLSASQACDPLFAEVLLAKVASAGAEPSDITVGVDEATMVAHGKAVTPTIHRLSAAGVLCALDDFGLGGMSLPQLQMLPVDELRIDRSLVHAVTRDRRDMTLVDGIVALGTAFGLRIVAAGVESQEQQALLAELGCDAIQGYLVAPRMPMAEVQRLAGMAAAAAAQRVSGDVHLRSVGGDVVV